MILYTRNGKFLRNGNSFYGIPNSITTLTEPTTESQFISFAAAVINGTGIPTAANGKSWYADVRSLMGSTALGTTVGRTNTSNLTVLDGATMTSSAILALLPSGCSYSTTNNANRIDVNSANVIFENYLFRNIRIQNNSTGLVVRQCVIYPTFLSNGVGFLMVQPNTRVSRFGNNTVIGPRTYDGSGQVVQCQYSQSNTTRGIVDTIDHNMISGLSGDCFSVTGSPVTRTGDDPNGTWIHHNLLDCVAYVTNFPNNSGKTGNWFDTANAPHGDLITIKGSYDEGVVVEKNVFWHLPIEPITISSSIAADGVTKTAGAFREWAGSRGSPLGNVGHSAQNNAVRAVEDNLQFTDSTSWAGPVRVRKFIHAKWVGMSGKTFDHSTEAIAASDYAVYDAIVGASGLDNNYTTFSALKDTSQDKYFLNGDMPTYSSGLVNFWTASSIATSGNVNNLASPL